MMRNFIRSLVLLVVMHVGLISSAQTGYFSEIPDEVILVFDQPVYAPGDTVRFAGYITGPVRYQPERQILSIKLAGYGNQQIVYERVLFKKGTGSGHFVLPVDTSPGVYTLGAYTESQPVGSSLQWLIGDFVIVDNKTSRRATGDRESHTVQQTSSINLRVSRKEIGTRQEVKLDIQVNDKQNLTDRYTVVVYNESIFSKGQKDFVGNVVRLLLTKPKENPSELSPAVYPYFFRGRAILDSGSPVPDSTLITFYLNDNDFVFSIYAISDGQFEFPLFKEFGNEEVFYTARHRKNVLGEVKLILEDQPLTSNSTDLEGMNNADAYGVYKRQKKVISSSYQHYLSKRNPIKKVMDAQDEIDADVRVDISKFESFKTMAEMFMNIVPMVRYRKVKGIETLRVFVQKTATFAQDNAIFIVDGVMTDNIPYVLGLNPGMVKRISVLRTINTLRRFGDLGDNGIIVIETGIINHPATIQRTSRSLFVTGISRPLQYDPLTHSATTLSSRIPDLRPVLYWNPSLPILATNGTTLSFFTSDDTGNHLIQVFAYDQNGQLSAVTERFQVLEHQP
jgi:hypothetical protein